jgi:dynein light chain roadblock-type
MLLTRLSSKPSVDSLLVLARDTGAIIRSTGPLLRSASTTSQEYAAAVYKYVQASEELAATLEGIDGGVMGGVVVEKDRRESGAEVETVRDDVRLLRFRTRRRELVVVPGGLLSVREKGLMG